MLRHMRRRDLLKAGLAGAATGPWFLRRASAQDDWGKIKMGSPWGTAGSPIKQILEIYIYGGLSPWETFFLNPTTGGSSCGSATSCPTDELADASKLQWGLFQCAFQRLSAVNAPNQPVTRLFDRNIHLGPATRPLWRTDLLDRMRTLVTTHDLLPHEAAIPFCLTGTRLGKPTMAGTGAAVERRYGRNGIPAAYIIRPEGTKASDNVDTVLAVGQHPASSRPLLIDIKCGGPELGLLTRADTVAQDNLLKFYREQYQARLTRPGQTTPVRNRAFNEYMAMTDSFFNRAAIKDAVGQFDVNDPILDGTDTQCHSSSGELRCPNDPFKEDSTRQALAFAAYLLRTDQTNTKYVCVVDAGRESSPSAGYDTHGDEHAKLQYRNLSSTLSLLAALTKTDASNPVPKIPAHTLIVITTEFGRSPDRDPAGGRKHWPHAYTQVLLPPAHTALDGKTIVGSINRDARVDAATPGGIACVTPTDLRAALLMALEIDPFADGNFGSGGLSEAIGGGDTTTGKLGLVEKVLGYDVS